MLNTLLNPKSIAIVGVSQDPKKVGYLVAKNMLEQGYQGELYFVNPKGGELLGKKVLTSLAEVPLPLDVAVICTPADVALSLLLDIKKALCRNVVLFAAGFKESGDEVGMKREEELIKTCKDLGITLLGPNCIGYVNTLTGVNATFFKYPSPQGNIGFISQSGALGSVFIDSFVAHKNLGFSYMVSLGNKSIVDETDVLVYLADNPETKVVGMYLEDVKRGEKFKRALAYTTAKKPVFILKSGTSKEGQVAAVSHTGGLLGDDNAYTSVFEQYGAKRVYSYEELYYCLLMASMDKLPSSKNILVLSNAGGIGVLLADKLTEEHLTLETITAQMHADITAKLPSAKKITLHNPIDVLGDASAFEYKAVIDATAQTKDIGATIVLLTPQANTQILETAQVLIEAQKNTSHPIYPVFMGDKSIQELDDTFIDAGLVSFPTYTLAASCIARALYSAPRMEQLSLQHHSSWTYVFKNHSIETLLKPVEGKQYVSLVASMEIFMKINLPVEPLKHVADLAQAKAEALRIGFPIVLKTASIKNTHKTEIKGVFTHVYTQKQLEEAFTTLNIQGEGALMQKQLEGHEIFVGIKRDQTFGLMLVVGIGGVFTELIEEIVYFNHPVSKEYFTYKIMEHKKLQKLFKGFRGIPPIDMHECYAICSKLLDLCATMPSIKEVDINPLLATSDGLKVIDGRIILS